MFIVVLLIELDQILKIWLLNKIGLKLLRLEKFNIKFNIIVYF